jgi:hypothetical protein
VPGNAGDQKRHELLGRRRLASVVAQERAELGELVADRGICVAQLPYATGDSSSNGVKQQLHAMSASCYEAQLWGSRWEHRRRDVRIRDIARSGLCSAEQDAQLAEIGLHLHAQHPQRSSIVSLVGCVA